MTLAGFSSESSATLQSHERPHAPTINHTQHRASKTPQPSQTNTETSFATKEMSNISFENRAHDMAPLLVDTLLDSLLNLSIHDGSLRFVRACTLSLLRLLY
jgi:hypothetical protein